MIGANLSTAPGRLQRLPLSCRPFPAPASRRGSLAVAWASKPSKKRRGPQEGQKEAGGDGGVSEEEFAALMKALEQQAVAMEEEEEGTSAAVLEEDEEFQQYGKQHDPPGHKAGFVAIIGKPNAGKSTLMNLLLGQQLSIVTEKVQTTRHKILGILSEDAYQIVFLDTPGIIEDKRNRLEERMMRSVQESVKEADAILAMVDAAAKPREALAMIQPGPDWSGPPMAVVLNKMDLLSPEEQAALQEWFKQHCAAECTIPVSALNGTNTAAVVDWVVSKLPEGPSMYPKGYVAEAPERFFVSEIIRRNVFLQYQQEIPYSVAVEVVQFKERRPPAKDFVEAHIIVELPRQRGILLGKGGAAIKALSTASRKEIEEFVGRPVFLQLSVKVVEGWRKDPQQLERLGY